jgi:hypothetical protein
VTLVEAAATRVAASAAARVESRLVAEDARTVGATSRYGDLRRARGFATDHIVYVPFSK